MAQDESFSYEVMFQTDSLPPGAARVRGYRLREGLSLPYEAEIDLEILDADVETRAWIRQAAELFVVRQPDGRIERRLRGVMMNVRERVSRSSRQHIQVKLCSPLALLALSKDYRIFQKQTTQEIATILLDEAGVAEITEFRITGSYQKREVCTQYGEDTLSFLSRILEEDGIFYFFEHGSDRSTLVLADGTSGYAATEPSAELTCAPESGLVSSDALFGLTESERIRPAKVTLRDHDFKKPSLDLEAKAENDAPLGREHYEYPGRYVEPSEGSRRAAVRLEAMTADSVVVRGEGTVFGLTPGHTFSLSGAADPALDREWVVRNVGHDWDDRGGQPRFSNRFDLLPKDMPFRPPQKTPRAVVPGPQLARVTGPAGEEIHTEEFGRVTLHFPWDRRSKCDDKSSGWTRVGQLHTSGSVAIPRVGWEVLVDFEDGDPDKPIVLGRLYNGRFQPPYSLPGGKTVSTLGSSSTPGGDGHNEIRMEDGGGGEQIQVHSQKDQTVNVANNKTEKIATKSSTDVKVDHTLDVGANETLKVSGGRELTVGASQTWAVGASRTKNVSGDEKIVVKGSRTMTIGASHTTMTPMSVSTSTPASLTETIGGSLIEAAAMEVGTTVLGATSVTIGGAKIDACATGLTDMTLGAKATTVGGALVTASGADISFSVQGAKATTVGGVLAANAGGDVELSSSANLSINVGGAVAMNAAKIVMKVGGSTVTIATGAVVLKSATIKLTATGPQPELAPMVEDK